MAPDLGDSVRAARGPSVGAGTYGFRLPRASEKWRADLGLVLQILVDMFHDLGHVVIVLAEVGGILDQAALVLVAAVDGVDVAITLFVLFLGGSTSSPSGLRSATSSSATTGTTLGSGTTGLARREVRKTASGSTTDPHLGQVMGVRPMS